MEENILISAGVDVGTKNIRAVVGKLDADGKINILGYGEVASTGMRRGVVADLATVPGAIDSCLLKVEQMSGEKVDAAVVSVNGSHIICTRTDGMIAVDAHERGIEEEDLDRLAEVASMGKVPANRETLSLVSHEYILDGQNGIKNPIGMNGSRLEVLASTISGLMPDCNNMYKICERAEVEPIALMPTVMASGRAVLTSQQMENGVAVVDMGATTTGVAIYMDGELQFVSVMPRGANDITNDLAKVLEVVPEVAEEIKVRFVTGKFGSGSKDIEVSKENEKLKFKRAEVDEVVEARMEEIFAGVAKALRVAGYEKRLPEGVILTGGGAKMKDIDIYARQQLGMAIRIGEPHDLKGVGNSVSKPEYSVAVGLLMRGFDEGGITSGKSNLIKKKSSDSNKGKKKSIFSLFK